MSDYLKGVLSGPEQEMIKNRISNKIVNDIITKLIAEIERLKEDSAMIECRFDQFIIIMILIGSITGICGYGAAGGFQ